MMRKMFSGVACAALVLMASSVGQRPGSERGLVRSNESFAMTEEYLAGERYHDCAPWFFPWCPNASGSGRLVQMLLDIEKAGSAGGVNR